MKDDPLQAPVFRWLALLWAAGVLGLLAFRPPFWALMDDAANLTRVGTVASAGGFGPWFAQYTHADLHSWGMFRPVYALFIYGFYGAFANAPAAGYAVLAAAVLALFWGWAKLFEKAMGEAGVPAGGSAFFFVLCFLFTPHTNLFLFASLQEKFLLAGGLAMYEAVRRMTAQDRPSAGPVALLFLGFAFALLSKATALFLAPPLALWLLAAGSRRQAWRWGMALSLAVFSLGSAVFFMRNKGNYTDGYQVADLLGRLLAVGPRFQGAALIGAASALALAFGWWRGGRRGGLERLARLELWPFSLLCFLAIMLPWKGGVGAYLIVPAGVFLAGTAAALFREFGPTLSGRPWRTALAAAFLLAGSAGAAVKWKSQWDQHHGAGKVLEFLREADRRAPGSVAAAMPEPCEESSLAMSFFAGKQGLVRLAQGNRFPPAAPGAQRLLVVNLDCTSTAIEGFSTGDVAFRHEPWRVYREAPTAGAGS